mmetsp:Transcript_36575/g.60578  ORF Transcript_36575/g.60578 Transcript_36575/m.60578 type:complete len:207 (-) Transcript_36575:156-776(-)
MFSLHFISAEYALNVLMKTGSGFVGAILAVIASVLCAFIWRRRSAVRLRVRAGCVPLRVMPGGQLHVMLIRSRKYPAYFVFPAGGVEHGESIEAAAAREAMEEAGVTGKLGRCLGCLQDQKANTTMFALHVEEELSRFAEDWRSRRWYNIGVPQNAASQPQIKQTRAAISSKPIHQQTFDFVLEQSVELVRECEAAEIEARNRAKQ